MDGTYLPKSAALPAHHPECQDMKDDLWSEHGFALSASQTAAILGAILLLSALCSAIF